eukprot:3548121-Prymnesium_polylepis.2
MAHHGEAEAHDADDEHRGIHRSSYPVVRLLARLDACGTLVETQETAVWHTRGRGIVGAHCR